MVKKFIDFLRMDWGEDDVWVKRTITTDMKLLSAHNYNLLMGESGPQDLAVAYHEYDGKGILFLPDYEEYTVAIYACDVDGSTLSIDELKEGIKSGLKDGDALWEITSGSGYEQLVSEEEAKQFGFSEEDWKDIDNRYDDLMNALDFHTFEVDVHGTVID